MGYIKEREYNSCGRYKERFQDKDDWYRKHKSWKERYHKRHIGRKEEQKTLRNKEVSDRENKETN